MVLLLEYEKLFIYLFVHFKFILLHQVYYKDAISAIIVFDMESPKTLQTALKWKKDVDEKVTLSNGQPIPVILVGNKVYS